VTPRSAPRKGPAPRRVPSRSTAPRTGGRGRDGLPGPRRSTADGLGGDQVEGRQAVVELLRAKRRTIRKILMADSLDPSPVLDEIEDLARRQRVMVQLVSFTRLDREARTEGHQGVVAFADRLVSRPLEELLEHPLAFLVVCDGVTDPRNLGAILRSADGAGVTGVVLPRHRTARISPAATKTAAGAIEYLQFAEVGGIPASIDTLNRANVLTVGLDGDAKTSLYDLDFATTAVALVVGGEESGLTALTRKRCGAVVAIPQLGTLRSLNAGVAVSVAAYEVARQRGERGSRVAPPR
jgi:23S rRNA (guanosine2251-2'-O)-methyltransferase